MSITEQDIDTLKNQIIRGFEKKTGLIGVNTEIKSGGVVGLPTLVFHIAHPANRYYRILTDIKSTYQNQLENSLQLAIVKSKENINEPEAEKKMFLRTLSESLMVNRYSFTGDDFFLRYIHTASGAEEQISASANYIVYGRRGSGKSTLLLYALHTIKNEDRASSWIDMQTYSKRNDEGVIADVLCEILEQFAEQLAGKQLDLLRILKTPNIELSVIRRHLPSIKNCLIPRLNGSFIFLDDFHVLEKNLQPLLLDVLYSVIRGSRINVKISAIENLATTYDTNTREGMQIGHDIQPISLDYNLTTPDETNQHIVSILDTLAQYCGLVSAGSLCTGETALNRLVWITAGVPRDAMSVFSQALSKSKGNHISVLDVNSAGAELRASKQNDMENDTSGLFDRLNNLVDKVRKFCFEKGNNAFLVRKNQSMLDIMRLVDLRLLHIIHGGFTPRKAGEQYLALILDYGFYVGERMSSKIKEFNPKLNKIETKDLRGLPTFPVE